MAVLLDAGLRPHGARERLQSAQHSALAGELDAELSRLCAWWAGYAIDPRGGFHGEIGPGNDAREDAPRGAVLNARILWFFSEMARREPEARPVANAAFAYFRDHFVDAYHGGIYWSVSARGAPLERKKQGYAQAFAIYALCAYARATSDESARELALSIFRTLQSRFHDDKHGGWWEARAEDWSPARDIRLSERDEHAPKSMNTHLHVLEALTALQATAPSADVSAALRESIEVSLNRIIAGAHLGLFFERDWSVRPGGISFGHDIEASWLLCEAAHALGDPALTARVGSAIVPMAYACLEEAVDAHGAVANGRSANGDYDFGRIWRVQAEALIGFLNAYELTGEEEFYAAFKQVWRFIKAHHVDESRGEWRWMSDLDPPDPGRAYKAGFWKGPYHNGRAMMECARRLRDLARR